MQTQITTQSIKKNIEKQILKLKLLQMIITLVILVMLLKVCGNTNIGNNKKNIESNQIVCIQSILISNQNFKGNIQL